MPKRDPTRRGTHLPRLLDRVIKQRRSVADQSDKGPTEIDADARIATLERRIDELESLLEGLQDSVHREAARQQRELRELWQRTDAAELTRSLSQYSQRRGL